MIPIATAYRKSTACSVPKESVSAFSAPLIAPNASIVGKYPIAPAESEIGSSQNPFRKKNAVVNTVYTAYSVLSFFTANAKNTARQTAMIPGIMQDAKKRNGSQNAPGDPAGARKIQAQHTGSHPGRTRAQGILLFLPRYAMLKSKENKHAGFPLKTKKEDCK